MATFAQFIEQNVTGIVEEFQTFARTTSGAAENLTAIDLRDHAREVLHAVAVDMATRQSAAEQKEKAEGAAEPMSSLVRETACQHAQHRFQQGFTLPEMVSEYRALRASIIRRWRLQLDSTGVDAVDELTRFGEAIDEGLTEAIGWYSKRLEESRNLLIGVLAHDMRSPLGAVRMSAEYLLRTDTLRDGELRAASRIVSSTARLAGYVSDLLDFTRMLLGSGLPLHREPHDLASLCEGMIDEVRAAHPSATVELDVQDAPLGAWDGPRLSQLVTNLVTNAIVHGDGEHPVSLTISQADGMASLAVHNQGRPIPEDDLPTLFQPLMQRVSAHRRSRGSSGLGLGLYIAREIAVAHGGSLQVVSTADAGTTFTAKLSLA